MGGKAAIILVLGFSFILAYIGLNLNNMSTRTIGNMSLYHDATAAHNLATIGANVGLSNLYANPDWRYSPPQELNSPTLRGKFSVNMTELNMTYLLLRSVSEYPVTNPTTSQRTLRDTVEVTFKKDRRSDYSLYAWMTNFEGNDNFWVTEDTVWGKIHSNGRIHVNGRPVYWDKVTTSKNFDPVLGAGANRAILKNGFEPGVAEIPFPENFDEFIKAAIDGGHSYVGDIWVTLEPGTGANNDGVVIIRASQAGPVIDSVFIDNSFNGAILGTGRVNVQGRLDGQLSVGSLTDVYLQNNILYENPRTDDILGLFAERNVVIADNSNTRLGIEVHGNLFARTGTFLAAQTGTGGQRELRTLGSIIQYERGRVASYNGDRVQHGFSKRYRFDDRLNDPSFRPPYYPGFITRSFAISNWWESYRVLEFR